MNQTYRLIFIKRCQFFLIFALLFLLSSIAKGATTQTNFVCGYKHIVEYVNSLVSQEHHLALNYIENLEKGTLTPTELRNLVTTLMRYRLLPINEDSVQHCRFYSYMCVPVNHTNTIYDFVEKYVQRNPNGPNVCHIRSYGKEEKRSIFSEDCKIAINSRIRAIPLPLAIAQAGLESAWGTSFFSRGMKNFFGIQTTFSSSTKTKNNSKCTPARQNPKRCIYNFNSVETSFFIYSQILNSTSTYLSARKFRYQSELKNNTICETAHEMANGLNRYAEDPDYVRKLHRTIKTVCQIIDNC